MQTLAGEPILDGLPLCVPKILMPRDDVDLDKWACVACDQFESEPQYWKEMAEHVGAAPSALNLVFPEVYLASVTRAPPEEDTRRIEKNWKHHERICEARHLQGARSCIHSY